MTRRGAHGAMHNAEVVEMSRSRAPRGRAWEGADPSMGMGITASGIKNQIQLLGSRIYVWLLDLMW